MKIGITGMPGSGKSTIFRSLTGLKAAAESGARGKPLPGVVSLPDPRLDALKAYYKPKKATPLKLHVIDIPGPGMADGQDKQTSLPPRFVADMRTMDLLCAVIQGFDPAGGQPPAASARMRSFKQELIIQDLDVVDKKHERLAKGEKESFPGEKDIIKGLKEALESEIEIKKQGLAVDTLRALSSYAFLTLKHLIFVINLPEGGKLPEEDNAQALDEAAGQQAAVVPFMGRLELDLLELPEDERKEFLKDAGLEQSGIKTLIQAIFKARDLIVFFTPVGEELRAWGIPAGTPIVTAAGKIHTDMERGFIKADVMAFDDFEKLGSEGACRREGKLRQEGKTYSVQDGDIITIKFNV